MPVQLNTNQPISCSICLEDLVKVQKINGRYEVSKDIKQPNVVVLKKCAHLFHERCITNWQRECINKTQDHATCPLCRKQFRSFPFDILPTVDFPTRYCQYLNGNLTEKGLYPTSKDFPNNGGFIWSKGVFLADFIIEEEDRQEIEENVRQIRRNLFRPIDPVEEERKDLKAYMFAVGVFTLLCIFRYITNKSGETSEAIAKTKDVKGAMLILAVCSTFLFYSVYTFKERHGEEF